MNDFSSGLSGDFLRDSLYDFSYHSLHDSSHYTKLVIKKLVN